MIKSLTAYVAGAMLLLGLLGGWTVRDWKADADTLAEVKKRDALRDKMQDKLDAAAVKYEQTRADNLSARVETTNTIREVYRNVKVSDSCAAPDAVVGVLGRAVERANREAAGEPVAAVPGAAAAADAPPQPAAR